MQYLFISKFTTNLNDNRDLLIRLLEEGSVTSQITAFGFRQMSAVCRKVEFTPYEPKVVHLGEELRNERAGSAVAQRV